MRHRRRPLPQDAAVSARQRWAGGGQGRAGGGGRGGRAGGGEGHGWARVCVWREGERWCLPIRSERRGHGGRGRSAREGRLPQGARLGRVSGASASDQVPAWALAAVFRRKRGGSDWPPCPQTPNPCQRLHHTALHNIPHTAFGCCVSGVCQVYFKRPDAVISGLDAYKQSLAAVRCDRVTCGWLGVLRWWRGGSSKCVTPPRRHAICGRGRCGGSCPCGVAAHCSRPTASPPQPSIRPPMHTHAVTRAQTHLSFLALSTHARHRSALAGCPHAWSWQAWLEAPHVAYLVRQHLAANLYDRCGLYDTHTHTHTHTHMGPACVQLCAAV